MDKLYNLYEEVILEEIQRDKIYDAINKRHRVNITYNDETDTAASGKRTIEVYAYGSDAKERGIIRAYQLFGDTKTFEPGWKTFLVGRIMSWEPTNFIFYSPISDRDPSLKNSGKAYREDGGDKLMKRVHAAVYIDDKYNKDNIENTDSIKWTET